MTSGSGRNGQPSKISRGHIAALRLAPVILSLLLLAHPAASQTDEAEKLGPLDTIELSVTGWSALRGGAAEAALLNNSFGIDSTGMLELPTIGKVQAAGLTEQDLAKLIVERLQARSGFQERAVAKVHRRMLAVGSVGPEQDAVSEQRRALAQERARAEVLARNMVVLRQERDDARAALEAARKDGTGEAAGLNAQLTAERRHTADLQAELKALSTRLTNDLHGAQQERQAAEAHAEAQRELTERERNNSSELRRDLAAARQDNAFLRQRAAQADGDRAGSPAVERELASAKDAVKSLQETVRALSAEAHVAADHGSDHQAQAALSKERQRGDALQAELDTSKQKLAELQQQTESARSEAGSTVAEAQAALTKERQRGDALQAELDTSKQKLADLQHQTETARSRGRGCRRRGTGSADQGAATRRCSQGRARQLQAEAC